MFLHYLKIAWRNLLKYKTQNVISILGLAIGFTAFSFTLSWIRYERGYDKHIQDVDRVFCVTRVDDPSEPTRTPYALPTYLKKTFPEVEAACDAFSSQAIITEEQATTEWMKFMRDCGFSVATDTSFFSVFYPDTKINYPTPLPQGAAIVTRGIAEKWGIAPEKIGQEVKWDTNLPNSMVQMDSIIFTPIMILNEKPLQSNVAFRFMLLSSVENQNVWNRGSGYTFIRLYKGANIDRIANALEDLHIVTESGEFNFSFKVYPLREMRYLLSNEKANITFEALKLFSLVSLLVIICALINYVMLFVSRVKSRSREFALNKVNGASNNEILQLLTCEFLMVLAGAIFIGSILTELLFPAFSRFSMIVASKSYILTSVLWYSLIIIIVAAFITFVLINRFVRRTVQENIAPRLTSVKTGGANFSRVAIFVQLCIGVLLLLCTAVIFNQYHLMDQRVGYNRNDLMVFGSNKGEFPVSEVKKIAGFDDFIVNSQSIFWSNKGQFLHNFEKTVTDREGNSKTYFLDEVFVDPDFRSFLETPLLSGRDILPSDDVVYLINQTGANELGGDPLGSIIDGFPIIGVIPDLQVESPLVKNHPVLYRLSNREKNIQMCKDIIFRCKDDTIKMKVLDWFIQEFPLKDSGYGFSSHDFYMMDINEFFKEFTKSERNLLMLISIISGVAILIAVFGIYSMITLSCNQRRKEIAIRKVSGARAGEIFSLFFREYFVVTLLSCVVAFPIGVYIMQRWLEQYTRRVSMEWWLFAGIFVLVTLIVSASIFSRVNRAAKENPAEVVKSD